MPLLLFTPYFFGSQAVCELLIWGAGGVDWMVGGSIVTVSTIVHVFVSLPGGQRTLTNMSAVSPPTLYLQIVLFKMSKLNASHFLTVVFAVVLLDREPVRHYLNTIAQQYWQVWIVLWLMIVGAQRWRRWVARAMRLIVLLGMQVADGL